MKKMFADTVMVYELLASICNIYSPLYLVYFISGTVLVFPVIINSQIFYLLK